MLAELGDIAGRIDDDRRHPRRRLERDRRAGLLRRCRHRGLGRHRTARPVAPLGARRSRPCSIAWRGCGKPMIAAVEGLALGGGLEIVATCDLRIGGAGATFGMPEADVGVAPGWSGTQRLVRLIGPAPVKLMALAGERLDADAAERAGVLHRTVTAGTDARCGARDGRANRRARPPSPCSSASNSSTPPRERIPRRRSRPLRPASPAARRTYAKGWRASARSGRLPSRTDERRDDHGGAPDQAPPRIRTGSQ